MSLRLLERSLALFITTLLVCSTAAQQPDIVTLDDGTVYQGTIVREQDGYIWIKVGTGKPKFLTPDMIAKFTDNEPKANQPDPDEIPLDVFLNQPYEIKAWKDDPDITRAAVLSAEGMVGKHFAAKPLREAISLLKEEGVELVVVRVRSSGSSFAELGPISDVLENEYKHGFQLVGWIEGAVYYAAAAVMTIEELYFTNNGVFGAAIMHIEKPTQDVMLLMDTISKRGNHNPIILRSIFVASDLSYDRDKETGEVTLHDHYRGRYGIVIDNVLTLNSRPAEKIGLSAGTASTLDELSGLLEASVGDIEWVGEKVEGRNYPVCKAEKHQIEYLEQIMNMESHFIEMLIEYQKEIEKAQGTTVDQRDGYLFRAEECLNRMIEIHPNLEAFGPSEEWLLAQKEIIEELRAQ